MQQNDNNQSSGDNNNPTKELDEKNQKNISLSLHELAAKNDVEQLTLKLSYPGQDVDKRDNYYNTPLLVAAKNNKGKSHFEVIEILLNNGADPNAVDSYDNTPLWTLVEYGVDVEILRLFSKFEADFNLLSRFGASLLSPAIGRGDPDVLRFLVQDVGLDVNHKDDCGQTPLHLVAGFNFDDSHYDVLKFLLQMGADPNAQHSHGGTPLYYLIKYGNLRVIDLFLSYQANFELVEDIFYVCVDNNINFEVLEKLFMLLHSGNLSLDVNYKRADGLTAFHCAARRYSKEFNPIDTKFIKCFLKNGANINAFDDDGETPAMEAVSGMSYFISVDEREGTFFTEFLLEQSDFSKVVKDRHIFQKPLKKMENYIRKLILKHLAKRTFLKIPVHPIYQKVIEDNDDYNDYFQNCTKELEVMSKAKLKNSWISYFNLLVDGRRKLKNYAGNQDLIEDYKNYDWHKKFPIYGNSFKRNVENGFRRRKLFDKSSILLSDCLPIFNPNHLIVKDILDCVLSKKVLSKFCASH